MQVDGDAEEAEEDAPKEDGGAEGEEGEEHGEAAAEKVGSGCGWMDGVQELGRGWMGRAKRVGSISCLCRCHCNGTDCSI